MSPENTHKLMAFYMEGLILGVNTMYMLFCFFKLFLIVCIGISRGLKEAVKCLYNSFLNYNFCKVAITAQPGN